MRSNPYRDLEEKVVEVASRLLAGADPYSRAHEARLARTLDVLAGLQPEGRILELGTNGFLPLALKELFPAVTIDVTVFDEETSGGEATSEKVVTVEFGGRSREVRAFSVDLEFAPLPVADNTYDIVVCCEVIEHMEVDPMFMLAEVNRVLRPGGQLVLTTPNAVSSRSIAKMVRGIEPYFYMQYNKNRNYHRHNYEYGVGTLTTLLAAAGFQGKIWTEDLFEDPLHEDVDKLRTLGYALTNVGDNIIVTASKVGEVVDRFPRRLYV